MTKEEKKGLETLKEGTVVTIYFKDGFHRPTNGQKYKFLGIQGKPENMEIKDGYYVDGFVMIAEAIDFDRGTMVKDGKVIPEMIFPHTVKSIETDD